MHPSALFFVRLKDTKRLPAEGAVAQATEGERVQGGLYLSFVEHLHHLCRNLLHRFAEPPLGGSLGRDHRRTAVPTGFVLFLLFRKQTDVQSCQNKTGGYYPPAYHFHILNLLE